MVVVTLQRHSSPPRDWRIVYPFNPLAIPTRVGCLDVYLAEPSLVIYHRVVPVVPSIDMRSLIAVARRQLLIIRIYL